METRTCQNCKTDFHIEPDDIGFYEKMQVPLPTFCPDCRAQRRLVWRNNMALYSRTCDSCQKPVVSTYAPNSPIIQYCNKCWWSDAWDAKSAGVNYDFSRSFFEQYKELISRVPHMTIVNDDTIASINCAYTYDCWFAKNCYMLFSGIRTENVLYSFYIGEAKDTIDGISLNGKNQWLYECTDCEQSYKLKYSQFSTSCADSQFLYDCRGCTDCFLCAGLRNKKYCFKNVQYPKDEYQKILSSYKIETTVGVEHAQKEYNEFILQYPRKYACILQSLNCTGDLISNGKNSKHCFNVVGPENCSYYDYGLSAKDSMDFSMSAELSECYEGAVVDHSNHNLFGVFSVKNQNVAYTQHCHSSKHLFGCVGLRNSEYCILNKQYTKEEYQMLVPKIIEHMNVRPFLDKAGNKYRYGEFYPIELSPYGYNETFAYERFPLKKEEAMQNGFGWQADLQCTTGKETLFGQAIPETIAETSDDILKEILACSECGRNYKIVPNELVFYRKMNIPVPHRCFHCRHNARMARRNPFKLWHRVCMCTNDAHGHEGSLAGGCQNEFETSYAPERPEVVYCEGCYQKEVN